MPRILVQCSNTNFTSLAEIDNRNRFRFARWGWWENCSNEKVVGVSCILVATDILELHVNHMDNSLSRLELVFAIVRFVFAAPTC
jgi:hypothetical protein